MRWILVFAAALIAVAAPARAEEAITRFSSDVRVERDGSLTVTETIEVNSEGAAINHGIYRDFPTRYRGPRGTRVRVGFDPVAVTRDGRAEPFVAQTIANGVRLRMGSADVTLPPGLHRYVLTYRTTRQLGRFADFDELYWNVTGNGWAFPIEQAEARVRLPTPVRFGQRSLYTGQQASSGGDAQVVADDPGEIRVRTTRRLEPGEGLTIALAFPKGVVTSPSAATRLGQWFADWGPILIGLAGLAGLLFYCWTAYRRVGRDPRPGTVVPAFSPPDDLGPAAMRYVMKMGIDDRAVAAALIDLGVHGEIAMREEDGGLFRSDKRTIERKAIASSTASPEGRAMLGALLEPGGSIVMEQANHVRFAAARTALTKALDDRFGKSMFRRNIGWALAGLLLLALTLWAVGAAVSIATGAAQPRTIVLSLGSLGIAAILFGVSNRFVGGSKWLMLGLAVVFALLGLTLGLAMVGDAIASGWWQPFALPLFALPLLLSAFFWISAPTPEGRRQLDRIAGFRQYLSIAEGERLERMSPPPDTVEVFEKYLPFAIALEVENKWADRFQGVLAAAAATPGQGGALGWYSGSHSPWDNPGDFAQDLGSSLSSSISSASTAPGSSSGSGGGGSSGGGGGGGGGGGW